MQALVFRGFWLALPFFIACGTASQPAAAPRSLSSSSALAASRLGPADQSATQNTERWSPYDLVVGCDRFAPLDPPFIVVTNEDEYVRYFCVHSKIDWRRFRLAVYSEHGSGGELFLDTVTHDGTEWVVALIRTRICGEVPAMYEVDYVAVLVPAGDEPVRRGAIASANSCAK